MKSKNCNSIYYDPSLYMHTLRGWVKGLHGWRDQGWTGGLGQVLGKKYYIMMNGWARSQFKKVYTT